MANKIKCDVCPRCKDTYPGKLDNDGYHFHICGMSGNKVYTIPHKFKKANGTGYIQCDISGCALYDSVDDALKDMTESEISRWRDGKNRQSSIENKTL